MDLEGLEEAVPIVARIDGPVFRLEPEAFRED